LQEAQSTSVKQKTKKQKERNMKKIIEKIKSLEARGTSIASITYEGKDGPSVRNIRMGDSRLSTPPYGQAITSALFENKGKTFIRAVDHNKGENIRVFEVDKIKDLLVDGEFIKA